MRSKEQELAGFNTDLGAEVILVFTTQTLRNLDLLFRSTTNDSVPPMHSSSLNVF